MSKGGATVIETLEIKGKTFKLEAGGHSPNGTACIMEAISYVAGEPWSDRPACASPVIGAFCRSFWDRTPKSWPGLVERMERIAGSANPGTDKARGYLAADWSVRRFAPRWLRKLGFEDDAARLEGLAPVVDLATARAATKAGEGIRAKCDARYYAAMTDLREAAWAAGAAEAAGAAWAAWAAEAAEAAGAAWAAWAAEAAGAAWAAWAAGGIDWSKVKGKSYAEQKSYFRAVFRDAIDKAIGSEIEASIADGLTLLDAMLDLGAEQVAA